MKKVLLTFIGFAIFCVTSFAQGAQGCNGSRYLAGGVFENVTMTTVTYGENTTASGVQLMLEMDIYQPEGDMVEKRPAVVLAHGGSFITGSRADIAEVAEDYAKMGYVAISMTYRLFPVFQLGLPTRDQMVDEVLKAVTDMKAAIRFLRADAAGANIYKVDPDYIIAGGFSAGAITAMHAAQLGPDDVFPDYVQVALDANGGFEGTSGNAGFSSVPQAVINLSGGLHDANWIDADDIPFISFHGDSDGTVPYESGLAAGIVFIDGSANCHPVADAVGVNNFFKTAVGGDHTDIYTSPTFEDDRVDFMINGNLFLHDILCPNTVNVENELLEKEIAVYPNPATDEMTIDLGDINSMYDVVVYDYVGKVVYKSYNRNDSKFTLNKAQFGTGFFVAEIRVMEDGVQSITRKIVFE